MKERPILFTAPMVRAILEGRKTQTRRVMQQQPEWTHPDGSHAVFTTDRNGMCVAKIGKRVGVANRLCPHGQPGDRLWVREAWHQKGEWRLPEYPEAEWEDAYWSGTKDVLYAADAKIPSSGWRARPSIHMPRWACRLVLEITDVRVQRLQDISEEDARAEGASSRPKCHGYSDAHEGWSMDWAEVGTPSPWDSSVALQESHVSLGTARWAFAAYICELHGGKKWNLKPTVWDANPWVWAITFRRDGA